MVRGLPSTRYQLLTLALGALMVASVLGSLAKFWHSPITTSALLLTSLAGAGFGWLWWRSALVTSLSVVAGLAAGVVAQVYHPPLRAWLRLIALQWQEFYGRISAFQWDTKFGIELGNLFMWLVALSLGAVIIREALRRGSTFWSLITGILIFGIQWSWYFDLAFGYFAWYCLLAFSLWAVAASARRDAEWIALGRKVGYKSHFVSALAWILIAGLVGAVFPIDWAPVDLGTYADKLQQTFPALKHLRGTTGQGIGGRFSLKLTGFSTNVAELGGKIALDQTLAFRLVVDQPLPATAYLRGSTALEYTGRGWQFGRIEEKEIQPDGPLPTIYAGTVPRAYLSMRVEPVIPLGYSIFTVHEPAQVQGINPLRMDLDGNLWTERAITRTSPYTVNARWIMYNAAQIRQMTSTEALSEAWAPYLQVPDNLSERVKDLTRQLTNPHAAPLDKALAIESYLRKMPYTLDVPRTPAGRDFVDYFLFDLKQGYCVYYSSAMVVMLRQAGIPARWVQGFAVPTDGERTERDGKVVYNVKNALAHAWVEAYFPGFGWATFEPTPRADLPPVSREAPIATATGTAADVADPVLQDNRDGSQNMDDPTNEGGVAGGPVRKTWTLPNWAIWTFAGAAVLYLLWLTMQRRLRKQDLLTATSPGGVVQEAWDKAVWLMSRFGLGPKEHQTAREYADALSAEMPDLKSPAQRAADAYTSVRYGPPERLVDTAAAERTRDFWEKADELLFDRFGWAKYLWKRLTWW